MIHFGTLSFPVAPLRPTDIFAPASTPAHSIYALYVLVLAVTGVIFLVVFGMLMYAAVKFRSRLGMTTNRRRFMEATNWNSPGR